MTIQLAEGLTLPPESASEVWAFLGRRGSGKTYAAGRLIEQLLEAAYQVVILDPVGTWYGLRLSKDGKRPGLAIPVFGGQHGDIPLQPSAGALVARLVAEQGISLVLDVSEFSGAEQRRLVADFAVELLQAKKRHKSALMVVWEEAQEFAPQRAGADVARMLGAVEKLIKLGRNFGIGTALVTQRPQAVNKDVLNQAEFLVALQMTGPQERKTIDGWVQEKGADRSIGNELPSLPVGEALIWGPRLKVFGRYKILPKKTYDASSTPGATFVGVGTLNPIDLEAVSAAMAETIEKAKAEDPKELRRELAETKAMLTRALDTAEKAEKGWREEREQLEWVAAHQPTTPVLRDEDRERLTGLWGKLERVAFILQEATESFSELRGHIATFGERPVAQEAAVRVAPGSEARVANPAPQASRDTRQRPAGPSADTRDKPGGTSPASGENPERPLSKAERAVLSVLAQFPNGRTKTQVALLTGYSSKGGGFNNAISAMRQRGYLVGSQSNLQITDAGRDSGVQWEELPRGRALIDYWLSQLKAKAERAILEVLVESYPDSLSKAELGERTGYEPTGGGFNNALSRLRTLELIERGAEPRASDDLMEASR